jgi:eukaryotic-like serine/threonine-protein kinase
MSLFSEIKERRLLPLMGAYMVSGFVALEGVDQLIGNGLIPGIWYRIALILYLYGVPGSLSIAWFHGAKGRQKATRTEIVIQAVLVVLALATAALVVRNQRQENRLADIAASSGIDETGIAVLYFEDLSPGGTLDYVADGLTESLIDQLSEVRSLDVVSRNGVAQYRGTNVTPDSVARALKVGSLIRGSVEPDGEDLRITVRLVDGLSGADIERRVLEIPSGQFLAARDSVAENVGRILRRRLGEEVRLRERREGTESDAAWSEVQRSEVVLQQAEDAGEAGDAATALERLTLVDSLLTNAEAADARWVRPPARRAHAAFRRAFYLANGLGEFDQAAAEIQTGLGHADRALQIDPRDADALEQRGSLKYLLYLLDLTADAQESERLLDEAQADLQASIDADPTRATVYSILSHLYVNRGDNVSVILTARRAYEEDAYLEDADRILRRLFWAHYNLEQLRDAKTWCEEGASRFPDNFHFVECRLWLMISPLEEPDADAAWEQEARLDSLAPDEYERHLGKLLVAGVLMREGMRDSAAVVFASGQGNPEIDPLQELVMQEAAIRSVTGDPDRAVELLRVYLAADPNASFNSGSGLHWWWRNLAGRQDFQALLNR